MAKSNMDQDILKVLYSEEQLKARVQGDGRRTLRAPEGQEPLFLGVLKGSFIFMADIVRACQLKSDIEFIAVCPYQNATSSLSAWCRSRTISSRTSRAATLSSSRTFLDSGNTLSTSSRITYDQGRRQR